MNAADTLALARYVAHLHIQLAVWSVDVREHLPTISNDDLDRVDAMLPIVALQLAEQAGDRGRELYEASQ